MLASLIACGEKFGSGPMGGSDGYGSHRCNKYEKKTNDKAKEEIERFNFFHNKQLHHTRNLRVLLLAKSFDEKALASLVFTSPC